jgi:hypothetical protein
MQSIITRKQNMKPHKTIRLVGLVTGLSGLAITIALNLIALFLLKKVAAVYFSEQWWSDWFPSYIVWLTFTIIGIASFCWRNRDDMKADA